MHPQTPGPRRNAGLWDARVYLPMLTFLVSVDSGFQGIDEAGITAASVAAGTSGRRRSTRNASGGDEHSVRAAPSHEYVAAKGVVFVGHG